jgi:hypothetical protein
VTNYSSRTSDVGGGGMVVVVVVGVVMVVRRSLRWWDSEDARFPQESTGAPCHGDLGGLVSEIESKIEAMYLFQVMMQQLSFVFSVNMLVHCLGLLCVSTQSQVAVDCCPRQLKRSEGA